MNTSKLKTALVFWLVGVAQAQTIPDAGTLFRQAEQNLPMNRQAAPLISLPPPPLAINLELEGEKKAVFQVFKFSGNKRLNEEVLQAAISAFRQQEVTYRELHRIPEAIENAYRQKGLIVKVYLPRQNLAAGFLIIQILEEAAGSSSAIPH
jgi:hemolysin activation/secretion protein